MSITSDVFSSEAHEYANKIITFLENRLKNHPNREKTAIEIFYDRLLVQVESHTGVEEQKLYYRLAKIWPDISNIGDSRLYLLNLMEKGEQQRIGELEKQVEFLTKACDEREQRIVELHEELNKHRD